jgi:hypothetical protein
MGILRNIWNTLFGKSQKEETTEFLEVKEPKLKLVHKKKKEVEGAIYLDKEVKPKDKKTIGAYNSENIKSNPNNICEYKEPIKTFCEPSFYPNSSNVCNPPVAPNSNNPLIDIPNRDDFFVSNELIQKEVKTDTEIIKPVEKQKIKSKKVVIGQKTLFEVKDYLLKYGSIDVLTCEQIFKVKSLHNFIWQLRKEGLKIKTDKVGLHNELGEKIEVTNYRLISKK